MKYITYKGTDNRPHYIIVDRSTEHKGTMDRIPHFEILGAGFIQFHNLRAVCTGESISLNVPSRGEVDEKLIDSLNRMT